MPKKSFFCSENFQRIEGILQQLVSELRTQGINNPVICNQVVMRECYKMAETSVGFYNIEPGQVSHYKEIAHISHWISVLKPFRLENPFDLVKRLKAVGVETTDWIKGYEHRQEELEQSTDFLINEYLAYFLATTLISACQLEEIEKKDPLIKDQYMTLHAQTAKRAQSLHKDVMISMRYHTYSARGFAVALEGITRIGDI